MAVKIPFMNTFSTTSTMTSQSNKLHETLLIKRHYCPQVRIMINISVPLPKDIKEDSSDSDT